MIEVKSEPQYLLAVILLVLTGAVLIGVILAIRPTVDPVLVIGSVGGFITTIGAGVMSYMKSEETHLLVNSRMDQWIAAQDKVSRAEGVTQGTADEKLLQKTHFTEQEK